MPDPDSRPATQTPPGPPDPIPSIGAEVAPAPPGEPDPSGDPARLGRYRVLRRLGAGGMGVVYLAFDEALRRRVALKVLHPVFAAAPAARERFLREARTCARVRSGHVVTIHDAGEAGGAPFLAMEHLRGCPLDQYLRRREGPLPVRQVLRIGREAAEGLAAAHALGLVHRDVKPANLWLEAPSRRVKILDFGLAKPVAPDDDESGPPAAPEDSQSDAHRSLTGAVVGTPAYMSPEQARGQKLDARTDLFSLGTVLYRLTTGRLPFQGSSATALLLALVTDTPPAVRGLNPEVSPALADLIHRLLAKDPADRPTSAADVAAELGRIGRRPAAEDSSTDDALPMAAEDWDEPSSVAEVVASRTEPPRRAGGWVAWAAATALLVGVAGAAVWRTTGAPEPVSVRGDPVPVAAAGKENGRPAPPEPVSPRDDPPSVAPHPRPKRDDGAGPGARPAPPEVAPEPRASRPPDADPTAAEVLASPDWEWTRPETLGAAVNSEADEYDPSLTADGLRLVYLSTRGGERRLYEARRKSVDEPFGDPWRLDELGGGANYVGHPFLSADGLSLWFVANRPGEPGVIWVARRAGPDADWGGPEKLGGAVNTKAGAEHPAVSADGRSLYFVRPREGHGRDLWVSRRAGADAAWGEAEPLGPDVNTAADEGRLWPLPDGRGILFSRWADGWWRWLLATEKADGGWDLRVVRYRAVGGPSSTADGRVTVFRSSHQPGGRGGNDLWQMRRVPKPKAEPE